MADEATGGVFSRVYSQLLEEFAGQVGERAPSYGRAGRSVREEIVRCVWFGSHFSGEGLATDDGRRLEVLSPGWWNVEGGPDFVRAEFLLEGGGRVVGDVEVHTSASAWYAHGHHRQPEYNDVALHVVMWNDRQESGVRTEDGRTVPQLTLSKAVQEDIEELVEVIEPEAEGEQPDWPTIEGKFCGRAYREGEMRADWLGRLLDAAGDHRILTRAAANAELFDNHPREQLLYERLAEALGYKNNRMPFLQLAGLLPCAALRRTVPVEIGPEEKSTILEAAYLTVGGFMEGAPPDGADPETRAHCEALREAWASFGPRLSTVKLARDHWHFAGTRPDNYPTRRIAGLARLFGAHLHTGLFHHFLRLVNSVRPATRQRPDKAVRDALTGAFLELEHPYWSWRYSLGGRRLSRPRALVGKGRALSIVVDVLLPMLLAHAQREGDAELAGRLHGLWQGIPRREENAVTRRMGQTIFESADSARKVVNSARRQQGLHQLYRDCCRAETGCKGCVLYLAQQAGKSLEAP
jgi:hypothetical protein